MASTTKPATPSPLWLGRHVVGAGLLALLNPLIYFETNPASFWGTIMMMIIAAAGVVTAVFALFFTSRARSAWPKVLVIVLWALTALWTLGGWGEYQTLRKGSPAKAEPVAVAPATPTAQQPVARPMEQPSVPNTQKIGDVPTWSANPFERFDSAAEIEQRAKLRPELLMPGAWTAVLAWQAHFMRDGANPANHALYIAAGKVLEGIGNGRGICSPTAATLITQEQASSGLPAGTWVASVQCERQ